jgi:hypoxanthine phosphoribosyltransferase
MHPDVETVLIPEAAIAGRVRELGAAISRDFAGQQLHLVVVLRGAAIFGADLIRALDLDVSIDYIAVESYGNAATTSGAVRILKDLEESIESRAVLVVEDIIDTGLTLNYLLDLFRDRRAARVEVCALLDKPSARKKGVEARYVGFTVPDAFVVGYGLDYAQRYRGLPYVAVLKPDVYGGG